MLTVLMIIALAALAIALLLAGREFRTRRRQASASSARDPESARERNPEPARERNPEPAREPDPEPAREPDPSPLTAEVLRRNAPEPRADDRAERVKALQRQLHWLGFEPGPADGRYASLTTGAVRRFQEAHDLPVNGIVDRATADILRASVAQRPSADRIDRVKALQRQLLWLGLDPGAIDGRYGPQTTEAVRRFQEDHDVPATGIVDPATQRALQQSVQRTEQW